jgi:cellulose synthase/poly-beta-1,6-N-acetylglucosamine synthase-like glycosyltransferase
MKKNKSLLVSIGVFAYNEQENIENLLLSLLKQKTDRIKITEILVISSGSADNTNEIVERISKQNKIIKLIAQEKREGKASAINLFLEKAKSNIVVIESGDTIPKKECIENLCSPFLDDSNLGLTGARSIPTNEKNTCLGYIIHYWWWMHNELPRFGEMIAFRRDIVHKISPTTAVDEADIEARVMSRNYKKMQVPYAVVNNHGAEKFRDLINQRKRVFIGHFLLRKERNYSVQSFNFPRLLKLTLKYIRKENSLRGIFFIFAGIVAEIYSRFTGMLDIYIKKRNPYIWDISKTTKRINN